MIYNLPSKISGIRKIRKSKILNELTMKSVQCEKRLKLLFAVNFIDDNLAPKILQTVIKRIVTFMAEVKLDFGLKS